MKFVASYSGGKESALAVHKAILQGHEPILLITTYNTDAARSHFHGLTEEVLEKVSAATGIPLMLVKTSGADYVQNFESALRKAKEQGAEACVFGDIDIEGHIAWCSERCKNVGLTPMFPLMGMSRADAVYDLVDSGFIANITVVNSNYLSDEFLGRKLTRELAHKIAETGADICGESGEYHTFVSDGPIFRQPITFTVGDKVTKDNYAMVPIHCNSHKFFSNKDCKYFPCHKLDGDFNCLFCYCPLYVLGNDCGGNFSYKKKQAEPTCKLENKEIKICLDCTFPHEMESYDTIVARLKEMNR